MSEWLAVLEKLFVPIDRVSFRAFAYLSISHGSGSGESSAFGSLHQGLTDWASSNQVSTQASKRSETRPIWFQSDPDRHRAHS